MFDVRHGDCRELLRELPDNSVDAIVTDPPYELGFMGKAWDSTGIAYNTEVWAQCLRVLKSGGHLLAFGGSRTYHRLAVAIEDAGFQIRDQIMWVYGSGFPKSLDVSKAIDKAAGAQRQILQETKQKVGFDPNSQGGGGYTRGTVQVTAPETPAAQQWQGWGTALKPAHEPIVLARKPLTGTVAETVLEYGTGALNIDGCRVLREEGDNSVAGNRTANFATQETISGGNGSGGWKQNDVGRFPANFIHDGSDEVLELFPDSSSVRSLRGGSGGYHGGWSGNSLRGHNDSGSAARFFYCAKANKRDRNEGLDELPLIKGGSMSGMETRPDRPTNHPVRANHHPTVKPTDLMRYLCRLITPPNGTVLDPFTGSGSTGKAAVLEGFNFVGIEQSAEYVEIATARIRNAQQQC